MESRSAVKVTGRGLRLRRAPPLRGVDLLSRRAGQTGGGQSSRLPSHRNWSPPGESMIVVLGEDAMRSRIVFLAVVALVLLAVAPAFAGPW